VIAPLIRRTPRRSLRNGAKIPGIGHGFPVDPSAPASGYAGPWVVHAGLSAARRIAAFWHLDRGHATSVAVRR